MFVVLQTAQPDGNRIMGLVPSDGLLLPHSHNGCCLHLFNSLNVYNFRWANDLFKLNYFAFSYSIRENETRLNEIKNEGQFIFRLKHLPALFKRTK